MENFEKWDNSGIFEIKSSLGSRTLATESVISSTFKKEEQLELNCEKFLKRKTLPNFSLLNFEIPSFLNDQKSKIQISKITKKLNNEKNANNSILGKYLF